MPTIVVKIEITLDDASQIGVQVHGAVNRVVALGLMEVAKDTFNKAQQEAPLVQPARGILKQ